MTIALILIMLLILASAATAMVLRNLIHSALLLVVNWFGVAIFYLWAGAEFVAFVQILIYVGAVSMVVLFAVLLTGRSRDADLTRPPATLTRVAGALMATGMVASVIGSAILATRFGGFSQRALPITMKDLGAQLAGPHAASLLVMGVILTVALLGAIIIAAPDPARRPEDRP
ncbi:MAG: NADH-quinone oxidoreductase subunit J [Opitutaceae bacterium]|nr:NADH-quinone oxidoreductase subunit J [Opitutaceae bacterium]